MFLRHQQGSLAELNLVMAGMIGLTDAGSESRRSAEKNAQFEACVLREVKSERIFDLGIRPQTPVENTPTEPNLLQIRDR